MSNARDISKPIKALRVKLHREMMSSIIILHSHNLNAQLNA